MSMNVTSGYARPLECHELDDRFQAEQRLATFADTDDLVALDTLCLQARQLVAEQPIGSPATLCKEIIRDLTICLGGILLRYIRADWAIGIELLGEGEYSHGAWILLFNAGGNYRSLNLEEYVGRRFFKDTNTTFAELVEGVVVMAKQVPDLYIGGYGATAESG